MNVQSIVTDAIYSSLQDRQLQPNINAGYKDFALKQLNSLLDEWRDYIPFSQQVIFNNISNLTNTTFVSVNNVNFILQQNVSAPLREVNLTEFVQIQSVIGLQGIPEVFYFDQLAQTIQVYPLPGSFPYQFMVQGRIQQVNLGEFDTIPANMPPFMVNAVTYELAYRLCAQYGVYWDSNKDNIRITLFNVLQTKKSIDLSSPIDLVFGTPAGGEIPPYPFFWAISGGLS